MTDQINTIQSIVEWAQKLPPWQSDALRRLFTVGSLSDSEKTEIIQKAKEAQGIVFDAPTLTPVPFTAEHAPGQSDSKDITILCKMRAIKNVNALAEDQAIAFAHKGITVIYGDNGTGKSGYSRVLKRACRARHTEQILPNVLDTSDAIGNPEATFDIQEGEVRQVRSLVWREGDKTPEPLTQIAVFDAHCARIFIDEANTVSYIPYGLDVFPKIASLFDELKEILTEERDTLLRRDDILQELAGNHQVGKLIEGLSEKTDAKEVERLATLSDQEQSDLIKLDTEVKALEVNDPAKQAAAIRRFKKRISEQHERILGFKTLFDTESLQKLKEAWQLAKLKSDAAKLASADQFAKEPLPGVGSDVWREMFRLARDYSLQQAYPDKEFPMTEEGSYCPLCMQTLEPEARDRLQRFQKYIEDTAEKEAQEAKAAFKQLLQPIKELRIDDVDQALTSEIKEKNAKLADSIQAIPTQIRACKDAVIKAASNGKWESVLELPTIIMDEPEISSDSSEGEAEEPKAVKKDNLKALMDNLEQEAKAQDALVKPEERQRLKQRNAELAARRKLAQYRATVLDHIERFQIAVKLDIIIGSLNSRAVSVKGGELTRQVLSSALQNALNRELDSLNIHHIKLDLKHMACKGHTQHQLQMADANQIDKLTRIFSEGEQRVIAIASFMAELSLSSAKAGIVLDDPVSSLDHKWAEKIAERLVQECTQRQVIIFTHNISFMLALKKYAAKEQVPIHAQHMRRLKYCTGQCFDELPWDVLGAKERRVKLVELANDARSAFKRDPDGNEYKQLHDRFYSKLRATWERAVEENLFRGVVQRFGSDVSTKMLHSVVVDDEDYRTVYHAMSDSSGETDAHDHAANQHDVRNTPDDMDKEIKKLKDFTGKLAQKQQEVAKRRKASIEPPAATVG